METLEGRAVCALRMLQLSGQMWGHRVVLKACYYGNSTGIRTHKGRSFCLFNAECPASETAFSAGKTFDKYLLTE